MMPKQSNEHARYWCFLSYAHADNKERDRAWGTWLHNQLETYEVPAEFVGTTNRLGDTIPARIYPVFRDEEELGTGPNLTGRIREALDASRTLVVLCSPQASRSTYVCDEIRHFQSGRSSSRILAAILSGEPGARDGGRGQCFPEPLYSDHHESSAASVEPLAADLRLSNGKEGWTSPGALRAALGAAGASRKEAQRQADEYAKRLQTAKLKLVSGILAIDLAELTRRDTAYQLHLARQNARRQRRLVAAFASLAALTTIAGLYANERRKDANSQRDEVGRQRDRAETQRRLNLSQRLASESQQLLNNNPSRAGLWAAEALLATHVGEGVSSEATSASYAVLSTLTGAAYTSSPLGRAKMAAFSFDENLLGVAGDNGIVSVFDVGAPRSSPRYVLADAKPVDFIAFDVSGAHMVTHASSSTASLWSLEQSIVPKGSLGGPGTLFQVVAVSPDHVHLAGATDELVLLYRFDSSSPTVDRLLQRTRSTAITALEFSRDGSLVLSGAKDGWVEIWDTRRSDANPASSFASVHSASQLGTPATVPIEIIDISDDHRFLATASRDWIGSSVEADLAARVWRLDSRLRPVGQSRSLEHEQAISSVDFTNSRDAIITTSMDGNVRRWSRHKEVAPELLLAPRPESLPGDEFRNIYAAALLPGETHIAVANADEAVRIVPLGDRGGEVVTLRTSAPSQFVSVAPSGRWLVVGGDAGSVRVWDLENPALAQQLAVGQAVTSTLSKNARVGASFYKHSIRVWELGNPRNPRELFRVDSTVGADRCPTCQLRFSPDGRWVVYQSDTAKDQSVLRRTRENKDNTVLATRTWSATADPLFSPNSGWLLTNDGELRDLSQSRRPHVTRLRIPESDGSFVGADFSSADRWLFARNWGEAPGIAGYLWRLGALDSIKRYTVSGPAGGHTFSENERWLALVAEGTADYVVQGVAQRETGIVLLPLEEDGPGEAIRLEGHELTPDLIRFAPDGRWLLSATSSILVRAQETMTRLWWLDDLEKSPIALPGVNTYLRLAEFSPDGRLLITIAATDDYARVWRLDPASVEVREAGQLRGPLPELNHHWRVSFSPLSNFVVLDAHDSPTPYLWSLSSEGVPSLGVALPIDSSGDREIGQVEFSSDGRRLFVASSSRSHYGGAMNRGTNVVMYELPGPGALREAQAPIDIFVAADQDITTFGLREDARVVIAPGNHLHVVELLEPSRIHEELTARIGRNMTWEEWVLADVGGSYRKTFPSLPVHPSVVKELGARLSFVEPGRERVDRSTLVRWATELDDPRVCNSIAWSLAKLGDGPLALEAVNCALRSAPDEPDYRDTRGVARALVGNPQGAIEDFSYYIESRSASDGARRREEWVQALRRGANPFPGALVE